MNAYQEFAWRGLVYDATEGLEEAITSGEMRTFYVGFDPTAASLHVGNLQPMMAMARLQRAGHRPLGLVGGATGMVGDPSGKSKERVLLDRDRIEENLAGIRGQIEAILDFDCGKNSAQMVNNLDWMGEMGFMEFLRDVGKNFSVNAMMAKESVKRRLASEDGISYTEFSYMLLQAYDFLVLHDRYECTLQAGGSDQWGNIVAGIDLIRRMRSQRAYGMVVPLVTTSTGEKFGKSEAGAVWLDPELTSPFRFYQFWVNTDDRDVGKYLRYFTWLTQPEVEELDALVESEPQRREAQKRLAKEVTGMIHGADGLASAERATQVLFGGEMDDMPVAELLDVFSDVPSTELAKDRFEGDGMGLIDVLAETGVAASKGEARRSLRGGGMYVNNRRAADERQFLTLDDTVEGQLLVLRKGKKNYHLVRLV